MSDSTNTSTMASIVNHSIRDGIFRGKKIIKISTLFKYIADKAILLDEQVQRARVKKHPSDAQKVMDSLADNFSSGEATGYVDGLQAPSDQGPTLTMSPFLRDYVPTEAVPIRFADWGHRWRFMIEIMDGKVTIDGYMLAELEKQDPDTFSVIMESEVSLDLVFHVSGTVPREYIARLFRVLQLSAPATVGERAKASADQDLVMAGEAIVKAIQTIGRPVVSNRGSEREISHALVIGAVHPERMSLMVKHLEGDPLSEEDVVNSHEVVGLYLTGLGNAKTTLKNRADEAERLYSECETREKLAVGDAKVALKAEREERKKVKTELGASHNFFKKCALDLALDGALLYGCVADPESAVGYIERFFLAATENKATWTTMTNAVKRKYSNSGKTHNRAGWVAKWGELKRLIGENKLVVPDLGTVEVSVAK